jgi:hypothetical protein
MPTVEELITHACQLSPHERQRLVVAVEASLRSASALTPEQPPQTREEFRQRYQMTIDADLWTVVGSQPARYASRRRQSPYSGGAWAATLGMTVLVDV